MSLLAISRIEAILLCYQKLQYDESTQAIDATDTPILFNDSTDGPMSTMTFVEENLDSVMVRAVKNSGNGNDPLLLLPMFQEGNLVPRYYILESYPDEAQFNATMTLFYDESEFDKSGIEDESTLKLYRFNGASWDAWQGQVDLANHSITVDGVSELSVWAFASEGDNITGVDQGPETSDFGIPLDIFLEQNYPNPFNPETEIRFQLPEDSHVTVRITNIVGQEIRTLADAQYEAGYHSVRWDGKDNNGHAVASGIYFYKMQAGKFSQVKKMSLLR